MNINAASASPIPELLDDGLDGSNRDLRQRQQESRHATERQTAIFITAV